MISLLQATRKQFVASVQKRVEYAGLLLMPDWGAKLMDPSGSHPILFSLIYSS